MNNFLWALTTSIGSTVLLGYLLKLWLEARLTRSIEHEYAKRLAVFAADLKQQNDLEIERLKASNAVMQERLRSDLAIIAQERTVKIEWHHQRMAEAITKVYELLWDLRQAVTKYVTIFQGGEYRQQEELDKRYKTVHEATVHFIEYYRPRRILFSRDTAENIENLVRDLQSKPFEFNIKVAHGGRDSGAEWMKINEQVTSNSPDSLFGRLEDDFRKLLGHSPVPQAPPGDDSQK